MGGGAALDPGVHTVDLTRWLLGEVVSVQAMTRTFCWDIAPLDDNAFLLLETAEGKTASLHISLTQWKNRFRFDLFGQNGFLSIEGRGSSYGPQRLTWCRERPKGQAPPMEVITFDELGDAFEHSLVEEWECFVASLGSGALPPDGRAASTSDAIQALAVVEAAYRASETRQAQGVELL